MGHHSVAGRQTTASRSLLWQLALSALLVPASLTAGQSSAPSLADRAIQQFNTLELRQAVGRMNSGLERDYFAGVLASREGRDTDTIRLLAEALPSLRSLRPDRAAVALRLLADAYDRTFAYRQAAAAYDDLLQHFSSQLHSSDLHGARDDSSLAHVLIGSPAQTIDWTGPVRLATNRHNPLGLITTELNVNGVRSPWVLDTGANQSVVSRSFAVKLGLKMLPGRSQTSGGITGIENPLQVAILPSLPCGGAILHNVVLLVLDDANLTIPNGSGQSYVIPAIVGFPVLRALDRLTFHHDGFLEASANGGNTNEGSPMELKLLNPVAIAQIKGQPLPFTLDTGASGTTLSVRFYRRFEAEKATWKHSETKSFGGGGMTSRQSYLVPSLPVTLGGRTVVLRHLAVLPTVQSADIDTLFGNIGEDLLQSVESFTLDFSHMRIVLGEPLTKPVSDPARSLSAPPNPQIIQPNG